MPDEKKLGIKESLEVLAGLKLLGVSGLEIAKDGLGPDDLPKAVELIKQSEVLVAAVQGIDQVDDEIKDLDQAELIELGVAAFDLVKSIAAAAKK